MAAIFKGTLLMSSALRPVFRGRAFEAGLGGEGGLPAFSPAALFAANEPGFWLDPSDFSTMWQDHQGVTPVTATGQTVGLILDKRVGTRTEVFDDANVVLLGPATYATRVSPGVYNYCRDSTTQGQLEFRGLTAGQSYLVQLTVSAYAGAVPDITSIRTDFINSSNGVVRPLASVAGVCTFFLPSPGTFFQLRSGGFGQGATISNVSIKEVAGSHFFQPTAAQRPTLQAEGAYNFLQTDGVDDRLISVQNINPAGNDKSQVFVGARSLLAAGGALVETLMDSGSVVFASNGWWHLNRGSGGNSTVSFASRGTVTATVPVVAGAATPWTQVLTGLADIGAPSVAIRANGVVLTNSTESQGTGTYTTLPHAIGSRTNGSNVFNGRFYQVVARFGPNLTTEQIEATETFINTKTGAY